MLLSILFYYIYYLGDDDDDGMAPLARNARWRGHFFSLLFTILTTNIISYPHPTSTCLQPREPLLVGWIMGAILFIFYDNNMYIIYKYIGRRTGLNQSTDR